MSDSSVVSDRGCLGCNNGGNEWVLVAVDSST